MIPDPLKSELEHRVAEAVTPREAAVAVMKELQRHYGWLTDEAVGEAAGLLGLSPVQVEELATFYEMIYRRPVGKRVGEESDKRRLRNGGEKQGGDGEDRRRADRITDEREDDQRNGAGGGQLADVPRPAVFDQKLLSHLGNALDALAELAIEEIYEMFGERQDVFAPLAEGRPVGRVALPVMAAVVAPVPAFVTTNA